MKQQWVWLLAGWFLAVTFASCNQAIIPPVAERDSETIPSAQSGTAIDTVEVTVTDESNNISQDEPTSPTADLSTENELAATSIQIRVTPDLAATRLALRNQSVTPRVLPERVLPLEQTPIVGEVPSDLLDAIIKDLEGRLEVKREAITVIRSEAIIWPDGSLGCPKPGEVYPQAPVSGYWVVLQVDTKVYDYRASANGYFFICDQPHLLPSSSPDDPDFGLPPKQ